MKTRALFLVPLLALLGVLGCDAKTNAPVTVVGICAPPDDAKACSFDAPCEHYIGFNVIDVSLTNALWTVLEVSNQAANTANVDTGRVNTADAWIREARVTFSGANVPESRYPILGSAFVPADGVSAISVLAVNETVGAQLAALVPVGGVLDVVGRLRLRGVHADTDEFETGDYEVPIRFCDGCVAVLSGCATADEMVFTCPSNPGQLPAAQSCAAP